MARPTQNAKSYRRKHETVSAVTDAARGWPHSRKKRRAMMKEDLVDSSHRPKRKAPRLIAGTPKAKKITAEKQRGQSFLRKLRATGEAWWTTPSGTRCRVVPVDENGWQEYDDVLAVIGNRLRVGMIADKNGTMVVGNFFEDDAYTFIPDRQIVGIVKEMHGKDGSSGSSKDEINRRITAEVQRWFQAKR